MSYIFSNDFIWGVATSAAQIEGAWNEGRKGESIWDRFSRSPGAIADGSTPSVACDHYHRFEEDIALMKKLGVSSYRLSLSWPRIIPSGDGAPNPEGISYYHRLLRALKSNGIKPNVTLYHWDLPQALQDKGGWGNRETVAAFERYARLCFREFDDEVDFWATHNEPHVTVECGHRFGVHAPGIKDDAVAWRVLHHLMLSHGRAVRAYRELNDKHPIGIVLNMADNAPAGESAEDARAVDLANDLFLGMFGDPIFLGKYPESVTQKIMASGTWPCIQEGDMETIHVKADFCGLNYYAGNIVSGFDADGSPLANLNSYSMPFRFLPTSREKTEMGIGWDIVPDGLVRVLALMARRYPGIPLMVTENGAAYGDSPGADGLVHDTRRVEYLKSHVGALAKAIAQGIPLQGYYHWSLLDNFEWSWGYSKRFGLVYVDFITQKRTPKDSFTYFSHVIKGNSLD
jgi:beta-glucosidase